MAFNPEDYKINETTTLREYQLRNLDIFIYFDRFCRKYDLNYYICGGTCIGAIRHNGFIPWDCDIDVFMLREDYENLGIMWDKYADVEHYSCDRTNEFYNMHAQCIRVKDNFTTYIRNDDANVDMNHGIGIDIIPLDALSNSWFVRQWQKLNGLIFCLFNAQRLPHQQGRCTKWIAAMILSIIKSPKMRYKIWKNAENNFTNISMEDCSKLGELTTGIHNINLEFPKTWFQRPKEMDFENIKVLAPAEPDKYLEIRYPGYMKYPPPEEQTPKFDPAFVDIYTPYKKYKGEKYCIVER